MATVPDHPSDGYPDPVVTGAGVGVGVVVGTVIDSSVEPNTTMRTGDDKRCSGS